MLADNLKTLLATEYAWAIKTQFFHWNVEGINFRELHDLFGTIYEEVYGSIDDFAEKIRSLGTYVPASYSRFNMLTQISDETEIIPKDQMVAELMADNEKIIQILKMVYDRAEAAGEHGFSNYLAERMDAHRKHSWQLRATAK